VVAVPRIGNLRWVNIITSCSMLRHEYREMIAGGASPRLAEMLVLQQGPSLQTDTRWLTGHVNKNQFAGHDRMADLYMRQAKRFGVVTENCVYKHQLARFPGDPEAWVSSRADVKKICADRNWECEGSVTHRAEDRGRSDPFAEPYQVAEDIVRDGVEDEISASPGRMHEADEIHKTLSDSYSGREQ
jgi:hypothetical protein